MSDTPNPNLITLLLLLLSLGCLGITAYASRGRSMTIYIQAFLFFSMFGSIINHLLGQPIYRGTVVENIPRAAFIFTLALAAMTIVSVAMPERTTFSLDTVRERQSGYILIPWLLIALITYTVGTLVVRGPSLIGQNKLVQIDAIGSGLHYNYLSFQLAALSLFFVVKGAGRVEQLYWVNAAAYGAYCLLMNERDFVMVIISIAIHSWVLNRRRLNWSAVLGGATLLYVATILFSLRSGQAFSLTVVLNQGSLLFIDSYVLGVVPTYAPYLNGASFGSAILNVLPTAFTGTSGSLASWLVDLYAPGNRSGYGFSLSAEAYINFGYAGVPIFFALLTIIHRLLANRFDRHPFYAYMSVYYVTVWVYAFRNESRQLFQACFFALLLFGGLQLFSGRTGTRRHGQVESSQSENIVPPESPLHVEPELRRFEPRPAVSGGGGFARTRIKGAGVAD